MTDDSEKHVVVTTSHRDVWYGVVHHPVDDAGAIVLTNARHCYYWGTDEGIGQLAAEGPGASAKIGPEVPMAEVHDIVTVQVCTEESVESFAGQGWGGQRE